MRALLLALQLATAAPGSAAPAPPAADSALRAEVAAATRGFLLLWRDAWQRTQDAARPAARERVEPGDTLARTLAMHCHWQETPWRVRKHLVAGRTRAHASCPMWYPASGPPVGDERLSPDAGLAPERRPHVQAVRRALLAFLDSAAARVPGDLGLARLRVRFALDAGELADAWTAAIGCTADAAGCGLLRGLVLHRAGEVADADTAFLAAVARMPDAERCAWTDAGMLLDPDARRDYEKASCAARGALDARLWWLADPLWLEPGNERRAEHFARKVLVSLLSEPGADLRQHWVAERGGEAVAETVLRYGWPTHVYWAGQSADDGHAEWLRARTVAYAAPYVVPEYTRGRMHTVPAAAALRAPFRAGPDAWQLAAPPGDDDWWPAEHWARERGPLVQLPEGQLVALRRRAATRLAWAVDLDPAALGRAAGAAVQATLLHAPAPDSVAAVGRGTGRVGGTLVVDAAVPAGAALVGVEVPAEAGHAAARTRFGVEVPPPLSALGAGRALSPPLLFDPPADAAATLDAEAVVPRMLGSTVLGARRVGIYWEAYGFAADDTVDLDVRIEREGRPGLLARIAGALLPGPDDRGAVAVRWREAPGSSRALQRREGSVPVQMRSVVLDVSRLERGRYTLTLTVLRAGGGAASSARTVVLR